MQALWHHPVRQYERASWILDGGALVLDAFGEYVGEGCRLTLYLETITESEQGHRDAYWTDASQTHRIYTSDGIASLSTRIPSWRDFLDNIDSYLVRLVLS